MRSFILCLLFSLWLVYGHSQSINDSINKNDAGEMLRYLSSDNLKGRVNFSKEQLQAAEFLSQKFTEYGLEPFPGYSDYYFTFSPYVSNPGPRERLVWNGKKIADSSFFLFSPSLLHEPMELADFRIIQAELPLTDSILYHHWRDSTNTIIWIDARANTNILTGITNIKRPLGNPASVILLAALPEKPVSLKLSQNKKFTDAVLYNVIGVLPGKTKPGEAIIFSAHYDHVNTDKNGRRGGIFNGANDNASGTTAVMMLARYFSMRNDNDRTLIFCLFAGEEIGLLGSEAFAGALIPESIKAVINIEMIGVSNTSGKNSFYVTGAHRSDVFNILKTTLSGKGISVQEDPAPEKKLFERSDNYPFVLRGIPAHSLMCSDDSEPCYHETCDDFKNADIGNMTRIIQAIALSCRTLISGESTPERIK